jgi:tRNA(Ile2) C34 agmatinyltransferase TiaS
MSVLWASLSASSPAACPVCGSTMLPRHSAGAGVVGGRCGGCGTTVE